MASGNRLVVIGIDAASGPLLRRWASEGRLPHLAALMKQGRTATVRGIDGFFTGATWPSLLTGKGPGGHGLHYPAQLEPGGYRFYKPHENGHIRAPVFWEALTEAGRRSAVVDVPQARLDPTIEGVQTVEWGGHDSLFGFQTSPPSLAREIVREFGRHPAPPDCDRIERTRAGYTAFVDALVQGVEARTALSVALLSRAPWDLFLQVFNETHCVGHQCWHLHDRDYPGFDAPLAEELGDPLLRVYEAVDRAVGSVLEAAGRATVLVIVPHGMSFAVGSHLLLPDILFRLGLAVPPPLSRRRRTARDIGQAIARRLPAPAGKLAKRALRPRHRPGGFSLPSLKVEPTASQCLPLPNGLMVSGVRLNLVGREPQGMVRPEDADALIDRLSRWLLEMRNDASGGPLVDRVLRVDDVTRGPHGDALPDVLVEWNLDAPTGTTAIPVAAGSVVRASSPRVGTVTALNEYGRTGEHRPDGLLIAAGPGVSEGDDALSVSLLDIAPTLTAALGVAMAGAEGRVITELGPLVTAAVPAS